MEPCGKDNKRAAFPGAAFTLHGACINHRDIQVCTPILVDGRMKYKQMMICPKCSRGVDRNCSNMCLSSNDEERIVYTKQRKSHRKQAHPIVSNKEGSSNSSLNTTFDTPFDSKGRCHHHKDVKLALKQCGEWKVLVDTCPMCREEAIARSKSSKPERSREQKYIRKYDEDGHCINHPDIRIAKKNMRGSWKVGSTNSFLRASSNTLYFLNNFLCVQTVPRLRMNVQNVHPKMTQYRSTHLKQKTLVEHIVQRNQTNLHVHVALENHVTMMYH